MIAYKAEGEWTPIDRTFEFSFSLNRNTFVELIKSDGEIISGYFKGWIEAPARSPWHLTRILGNFVAA